jgi:hypothetical protein
MATTMKSALSIALRVVVLTIIMFACFAVAGGVTGQQGSSQTPGQTGAAAALLAVCFLNTLVLTYVILRSRWGGWRLVATVFVVFYGVMTFMSQIESAVFITRLPPGMLPRLFLMGVLIAAPFSVLAVLILGKRKADPADTEPNTRLVMPTGEWVWKLGVIGFGYVILYFTFGYFIAWRDPAVREYYGGVDEGGFFAQLGTEMGNRRWLVPFQFLRGILWAVLAMPVIRMMRGRWPEAALAVGLLFAVVMNAQLLLPNPYMPDAVRMTHLIETASSNFIFGLFVGWLLTQRHEFAKVAIPQQDATS